MNAPAVCSGNAGCVAVCTGVTGALLLVAFPPHAAMNATTTTQTRAAHPDTGLFTVSTLCSNHHNVKTLAVSLLRADKTQPGGKGSTKRLAESLVGRGVDVVVDNDGIKAVRGIFEDTAEAKVCAAQMEAPLESGRKGDVVRKAVGAR